MLISNKIKTTLLTVAREQTSGYLTPSLITPYLRLQLLIGPFVYLSCYNDIQLSWFPFKVARVKRLPWKVRHFVWTVTLRRQVKTNQEQEKNYLEVTAVKFRNFKRPSLLSNLRAFQFSIQLLLEGRNFRDWQKLVPQVSRTFLKKSKCFQYVVGRKK